MSSLRFLFPTEPNWYKLLIQSKGILKLHKSQMLIIVVEALRQHTRPAARRYIRVLERAGFQFDPPADIYEFS